MNDKKDFINALDVVEMYDKTTMNKRELLNIIRRIRTLETEVFEILITKKGE